MTGAKCPKARPSKSLHGPPRPEGIQPWPKFLGYNRLRPRTGATVVARCGDDVFLAVGEYGKGRALAFASDWARTRGPLQFGMGPLPDLVAEFRAVAVAAPLGRGS